MATAELRLPLPVDRARDAVAAALTEQGFTVQPTATGSLDVSRGSFGTTLVAGAFAGQDMHVRFDVHVEATAEGALARFEHSAVGGFFTGGAVGAVKAGDVVREAAHRAGERLAHQGVISGVGSVDPAAAAAEPGATGGPAWPAPDAPSASPSPAAAAEAPVSSVPPPSTPAAEAAAAPGYPGAPAAPPGYAAPSATPAGSVGAAPGWPTPGVPGQAAPASDRTNGVAIAAIIMGFALPLGGIIAGAVALAQIKRTGQKGRGLAIGGIVAGSVLIVLSIIATLALVSFFLFGPGSTALSDDPFDLPSEPRGGGVTVGPDEQAPSDAYTLPVGSCLDDIPGGVVSPSNLVDCAAPHTYEVFGGFLLTDAAFPGDDALASAAYDGCDDAFPGYVGVPYDESALEYYYVAPTAETWADGDREVSCLLYDPAVDETTGSLAGSGR